jgi:hypothetical protein
MTSENDIDQVRIQIGSLYLSNKKTADDELKKQLDDLKEKSIRDRKTNEIFT